MAYQLENIKVLVIEDNAPMLELTKSILQTFGVANVITAKNGQEGYHKYLRENPDLIIADWMMKPMDGIALTQEIRSDLKGPNKFVPIILMTGFSEKRRVFHARDSGVTEFLVKPFNVRDLYRRIVQVIEQPRQFVRSEDFFGPDRRRARKDDKYGGPSRRETDKDGPRPKKVQPDEVYEVDFVDSGDGAVS